MSNETVLTDDEIYSLGVSHDVNGPYSFARAIEQAVLQSPEIQAMRADAERYRFCRSQTGPAEIHIHGVELGLAGDELDAAMDEEMEEWRS